MSGSIERVTATLEMMGSLAHVGHWSVTLIYLAPFAVVVGWIARDNLRRRRTGGARDTGEER